MFALSQSLPLFNQSLQDGKPVIFDGQSNWKVDHGFNNLIRILTFSEKSRLEGIHKAFCSAIDSLEYYNVCDQDLYLRTADVVRGEVQFLPNIWELEYRIYALRARLGLGEPPIDAYDYHFLADVCQWKQNRPFSPNGALSAKQKSAIDEVIKYPQFIQLLKQAPLLKDAFLNWTLRDENDPHIFMRYPSLSQKMVEGCISARIGVDNILRMDGNSLYLKCEGGNLDLRDPNAKVLLSEGYSVSLDDICNCFINRNRVFGSIESNATGFFNWSSRHYARYDGNTKSYKRINFHDPFWWKQLPYEAVVTPAEMQHRYQLDKLPDGNAWYYSCVGASESNKEVLIAGTHGYTIISIPGEDGKYYQYSFGKYMFDEFPIGTKATLKVALQTIHGRIISPDGTSKDTGRDKEYITVDITPDEGAAILEDIKQDILQGFRREIPFQLFNENCMHWSVEKIHYRLNPTQRQICYVKPFESKGAKGMLRVALFIYSIFPSLISRPLLNAFAWWFGGYNEIALRARDGRTYSSYFASKTPWSAEGFLSANPCIMLLRRRSGEMR